GRDGAFVDALAGALAGVLAGALAGALVVDLAAVFRVAFVALVARRERAAVFGGGALAVRFRLTALVAAVRRAVVLLAPRLDALVADFVVDLRLAAVRDWPRAGCFAVDRVALGMVDHPAPGKGCGTVPHGSRYFGNLLLAESRPALLFLT